MDRIQVAAEISIGRAVGFGALAVATVVIGLIFEPVVAFKTGGALTLLMVLILLLKAQQARSRPYRRTEVWLILDKRLGLPEDRAQRMVGEVLHDTYDRYARRCLVVAVGLWLLGLAFQLLV
ncbi:MAG TPA: hypothetical protein VFV80_13200 [Geminicoccaceae bacterium]|nr:hypothetical protein [Geminicoccaceae bacterium]